MRLACPRNPLQHEVVGRLVRSTAWLGWVDYYTDGEFECSDGSGVLESGRWGQHQPDNRYEGETDADFTVIVYDESSDNHLMWDDRGSYQFPEHHYAAVCETDCTVGVDQDCGPDR